MTSTYAPRVNADGVWQDLPLEITNKQYIDAIGESRKMPTHAEIDLDDYCLKSELARNEETKALYPLSEFWAKKLVCPECEKEAIMVFEDYICIGCRYAEI